MSPTPQSNELPSTTTKSFGERFVDQLSHTKDAVINRLHDVLENANENKVGTKALAIVAIGVSALTLAACSSQADAAPKATTSHSAEPKPTSTKEAEPTITAQSVEIPATTPVGQLAETIFTKSMTAWIMGGADKASAKEYYSGNLSLQDQAAAIANPIDSAYVQGIFTPAALNDSATNKFITDTETDHVDRLGYYLITANDPKVYEFNRTIDPNKTKIISDTTSGVELEVTAIDHNNVTSDDKIGSKYGTSEIQDNNAVGVFDVKLVDIDGQYKINSINNITSSTN